jgi:hypothetical protein
VAYRRPNGQRLLLPAGADQACRRAGKRLTAMSEDRFLESTSKFKVRDIVYDNGSFTFATGHWDGSSQLALACRWSSPGIGYPQTFGKPQWMLIPDAVVEQHNILDPDRMEFVIRLRRNPPMVVVRSRPTGGKGENGKSLETPVQLSSLGRLPHIGETISLGDSPIVHEVESVMHYAGGLRFIAEINCVYKV